MKDYSSIVVSSRVRFLRNLTGFEFPSMLDGEEGIKVLNKLADNILPLDNNFKLYKIDSLPELDVNIMHEKNLITSKLMDAEKYGAVILSKDEDVSVMINETDHICLECNMKGLNLINAYDKLNELDSQILSKLDVAYDDSIGFLTSNLDNVGTGLKAYITLFLPALSIGGKMLEITRTLSNQGYEISSISRDEVESAYSFTISNSFSIGKRESDYVVKITEIALQICEMEIRARSEMLSPANIDDVIDKVNRAWGILTNCYKIGELEAKQLLGEVKMGVALDLIRFKEVGFIDHLMIDVMPYSLTKISGSKVMVSELDKYRAKFLANVLKSKRIK